MKYLTRQDGTHLHHFRAFIQGAVLYTVSGVFYLSLLRDEETCASHHDAHVKMDALVAEKIKEGYVLTDFTPTPENSLDLYDKAAWHYEGDFPKELSPFQTYVHTGLFVGWLIDRDLMSEVFKRDFAEEVILFDRREVTGPQVYEACLDGMLMLEDLNETGNRFALHYFNLDQGLYLEDYAATLGNALPSIFHVADTWDNYTALKAVVDQRFDEWLRQSK